MNVRDVRMIDGRENLRLAKKTRQPIGIRRVDVWQHLERNVATEPRIAGAIDHTHAAGTERTDDLVRAEAGAGRERHGVRDYAATTGR